MGLKKDWTLRYAEVKPFVRILFPLLLLFALCLAYLGGYGAVDYLRTLFPVAGVCGIIFATGAISGDRATKRFDFSFALPYSRPSYFWSKFSHRFLWLCFVFYAPFAVVFIVERFLRESPDTWQLLPSIFLFFLWLLFFYTLTFLLSILSAYPLQELGRMLIYGIPIYFFVPTALAPFIATAFPSLTANFQDPTVLWMVGIALTTLTLLILTGLLFLWVAHLFLKKDWGT